MKISHMAESERESAVMFMEAWLGLGLGLWLGVILRLM